MLKKTKLLFGIGILSLTGLSPFPTIAAPLGGAFAPTVETNVVQAMHRGYRRHCGRAICGCVCPSGCISAGDRGGYGPYYRSYSRENYVYDRPYYRSYYREYDRMRPNYGSYSPYYDDERRFYYRSYTRQYYDDQPYYRVLIGK